MTESAYESLAMENLQEILVLIGYVGRGKKRGRGEERG